MTIWVVIPVKPPGQAKSLLSEVLDEHQRARLAKAMLQHVYREATLVRSEVRPALLGHTRLGLPDAVPLLDDPGTGLNQAVAGALLQVEKRGASRMVVLFADLPRLRSEEIERLIDVEEGVVAIAPDRHGMGTNALSLPLPAAKDFTFGFGPASFSRHRAEAARMGLAIEIVHADGLAKDVDDPEDLVDTTRLPDGGD